MNKNLILLLGITTAIIFGGHEQSIGQIVKKHYNQSLTKEQTKEDFDVLVRTLKTNHPGLYDYQNEEEFNRIVKLLETEILSASNVLHEYRVVSKIISAVSDAHTYAMNPYYSNILKEELLFPVIPNINNNQITIDGKRLKAINGNSEEQILTYLQSFANSDGNTIPYKNAFIEMEFPIKYFTYMDTSSTFKIVFDDEETITMQGKSYSKEGLRQHQSKAFHIEENMAILKIPSWEDETASSFNHDLEEMAKHSTLGKFIAESLEKTIEAEVEHLKIDLTGNTGGKSGPAAILLSYLIDEPFKYYSEINIASDTFPTKAYITNQEVVTLYESKEAKELINEIDGTYFFKEAFLPRISPQPKQFPGTVEVLVDKYSLSVSTDVVAILKKNRDVKITGSEMGGSLEHYCAGTYIYLKLPNSGIELSIPLQRLEY